LFDMEKKSYPKDEAASMNSIMMRLKEANDFFIVAVLEGVIIGFVNGTLSSDKKLSHESMTSHVPSVN